jgi:hypothetical protein
LNQPPQPNILSPKPITSGFLVGKSWTDPNLYAAVPLIGSTTQLVIIHKGQQLKTCRNETSARNFIKQHKKAHGN